MSPNTNITRLALVLVPTNATLELLMLWSKEPPVALKILFSLMIVIMTIYALQPKTAELINGSAYALMVILAIGVSYLEFSVAVYFAGSLHEKFALTPEQIWPIATIYAVCIGLPLMVLDLQGKEFIFLEQLAKHASDSPVEQPTTELLRNIAPETRMFAGGHSGCSIQIILGILQGLFMAAGDAIFSRDAIAKFQESTFFGICGPALVLVGGVSRAAVAGELGQKGDAIVFAVLWLVTLVGTVILAFLFNAQFVWISRLAKKIIDFFQPPIAPAAAGDA